MNNQNKINISILFQDTGVNNLDLRNCNNGNPGLGGTEYLFLLLIQYLSIENSINLSVYHFNENELPQVNQNIIVSSPLEAVKHSIKEKGEDCIFIMKNLQDESLYNAISEYKQKYIIWCHNFLTLNEIHEFRRNENIKRVIAVGRQMYDYYIDDLIINKMDFVYNFFDVPGNQKTRNIDWSSELEEKNVTYVGSLIYQKSFHVLAHAWKEILKEVPEAKLHVIGTGKLYDRNSKLGPLQVAEESYEESFFEGLSEDGKLLESVTFHGLLGDEKQDIFEKTMVGVVNPLASTETFCLCAIEMEAAGIPIVSRRKNGLLDTVKDNETGLLYKDASSLKDYCVKLLKDSQLNRKLGENAREFAAATYTSDKIVPEWMRVFTEVNNNVKAQYKKPVSDFDNNGKRVRQFIHGLHCCPIFRWIPSIHDFQKK